ASGGLQGQRDVAVAEVRGRVEGLAVEGDLQDFGGDQVNEGLLASVISLRSPSRWQLPGSLLDAASLALGFPTSRAARQREAEFTADVSGVALQRLTTAQHCFPIRGTSCRALEQEPAQRAIA